MIPSTLVCRDWNRLFKDPMTPLAAVDRIVHHSPLLDMTGIERFRMQEARSDRQAGAAAPTAALPGTPTSLTCPFSGSSLSLP
jgi:hypothetical protein